MEKMKLTKLEKYWILYDVGNSAFVLLASTIIPIYFNSLAESAGISEADYVAYWGYAASVATLCVAAIGPVLGSVADTRGCKKPLFTIFMMIGVLGCAALSFPLPWIVFLSLFVLTKVGYSSSLIFYDAMLPDVTEKDRMDQVSSHGYAWGYIGSCIPFIISVLFILYPELPGLTDSQAVSAVFLLNAVWWLGMTVPLLRSFEQTCYVEQKEHPVRDSFGRLWQVFGEVWKNKKIFWFLAAFFFYIDGVYTIIDMATAYGKDVGISDTDLILALLVMQVVAFPCSILFGMLTKKLDSGRLIRISILGYLGIVLFAVRMTRAWEFWLLAVCVAVFQGGIQALSRSYFTRIIPKNQAAEYFGFYDIFGKGAAFLGTLLVGAATQLFGTSRAGIGLLAVLFAAGYGFFRKAENINA